MMTMRSLWHAAGRLALGWAALLAMPAFALGNLEGGPAVNQYNLHPPASAIATDQQWLHNFMLIICLVIFLVVFGVMFYSIVMHRKSKGARAANFHESTTVEIAWTVVPFVIVILMALPATKTVVAMKDTSSADLTIKVTGIQWKWGYDYLKGEGEGIGFLSTIDPAQREMSDAGKPQGDDYLLKVDNALIVPVDKKVRLITTANDVIHAFYVPSLGVQETAIPGFVRDTWFRADKIGTFYGQCTQLCGKEHSYMPIQVKVVSQADYTRLGAGQVEGDGRAGRRPEQGLDARRPGSARRKGLHGQLPGLPPAERQGRQRRVPARRLAGRARRRQEQADPGRPARPQCHAPVAADERHRHRVGDHFHEEPLVERHGSGGAADRSRGGAEMTRPVTHRKQSQ